VENRAGAAENASRRAAVHHSDLTGRAESTPRAGWRARSHDSQRRGRLSAFGLFGIGNRDPRRYQHLDLAAACSGPTRPAPTNR